MIVFSQILMCSADKQQSDLSCIYLMSAVHVTICAQWLVINQTKDISDYQIEHVSN